MKIDTIIPDLTIITEGFLSKKITAKELEVGTILIHEAIVSFLEKLTKENKTLGSTGIEELENLKELEDEFGFKLEFSGMRPRNMDLERMDYEDLDSYARELAFNEGGFLYTASKTQEKIGIAKGVKVILEDAKELGRELELEKYFDETTMSVHLRENVKPYAKKGMPGTWGFHEIGSEELKQKDIERISREIIEEAKINPNGFIEIERFGSSIIQLGKFRIVITKPPFSDGWEITAVRPVKKLGLLDYDLSEKLMERLETQAEGVLIAGSPGMGKTTFAAALAEFYADSDKVVKTVEAPRDLVLPEKVTQYAITHGTPQEIHDILLLSRPDYTIFDEIRNTDDFKLFADLRLAGIGFIGVMHATAPVDAIQRFVGRVELGVIPQIIDTVVFIKDGGIGKVLNLSMQVKVPAGMTEQDLARPIVVVNDFETGLPEFEIYSYGEETVVIPVKEQGNGGKSPSQKLAVRQIEKELSKYGVMKVEMLTDHKCRVFLPEEKISKIIGKQGKTISELEKRIGIGIDVCSLDEEYIGEHDGKELIQFEGQVTGKSVMFRVDSDYNNEDVHVYVGDDYLLTAKVSKKGVIKVKRSNKIGRILADAVHNGELIKILKEEEN